MSGPVPGTPTPWAWTIEDYSMATLHNAESYLLGHVMSVSPCNACCERAKGEGAEWKWGRCTTPTDQDAAAIVHRVNNWDTLEAERDALKARVEALVEALGGLLGGTCPACKGWGEVSYFGEMVGCACGGKYQHAPTASQVSKALAALSLAKGEQP